MLSIINCSVNEQYLKDLEINIKETIGVPYEIIVFDNRNINYGLTKVYNQCAEKSQYPYLCFLHEDTKWITKNWGDIIIEKLKDKETGMIGFAGGVAKLKEYLGWISIPDFIRQHLIHHIEGKKKYVYINPDKY